MSVMRKGNGPSMSSLPPSLIVSSAPMVTIGSGNPVLSRLSEKSNVSRTLRLAISGGIGPSSPLSGEIEPHHQRVCHGHAVPVADRGVAVPAAVVGPGVPASAGVQFGQHEPFDQGGGAYEAVCPRDVAQPLLEDLVQLRAHVRAADVEIGEPEVHEAPGQKSLESGIALHAQLAQVAEFAEFGREGSGQVVVVECQPDQRRHLAEPGWDAAAEAVVLDTEVLDGGQLPQLGRQRTGQPVLAEPEFDECRRGCRVRRESLPTGCCRTDRGAQGWTGCPNAGGMFPDSSFPDRTRLFEGGQVAEFGWD